MHKQGYSEMKAGRRINDMAKIVASILVLLSLTFTFGCSSSTQQTTTNPGTTTTPPTSSGTFQAMANLGQTVYTSKCATCHGANGQGGTGPAVWGSGFVPGQYVGTTLFALNAQAMLNFISSSMPLTAPGTLSHTDSVNVLCYLLIQESEVSPSTVFNESQLSTIVIK